MKKVIVQAWLESEAGWGIRPDGCSIHINDDDRILFTAEYMKTLPDDIVPNEYSRPDGDPVGAWVTDEIYERMLSSEKGCGMWMLQSEFVKSTNAGTLRLFLEKS